MAVIFTSGLSQKGYCQSVAPQQDTLAAGKDSIRKDIVPAHPDSMPYVRVNKIDSLHADSVAAASDTSKRKRLEDSLGIKIAKDALPDIVKAQSEDSAVLDMSHNLFYLYGKAEVHYQEMQLNAGKITYQQSINVVSAQPLFDTVGTAEDKPSFSQGKEKFTYDSMQYNMSSKRAIVRNVRSQYGEGFVHSEQVKRNPDQSIYGWKNVYTTCALDTPHFGIVAKRIKVIPGVAIATGAANIVIEGVPTPLFLPFGIFPISESQHSGFIIPTYTIEQARGLGLTNGGYYFSLSDHADLSLESNIYTKGSYALSGVSTYDERYQYSGGVSFSYAYNKTGEDFEPGATTEKDFMLLWRHQTDAKAIPGQTFNASVQVGTSSFYSNNSYDPNQILQNQYTSNISYSKTWQGTPFSFTISGLHNQNTGTHEVNVTLPDINFHVTQLNPFQKKGSIGTHWYDKITTSYSMDALNQTTFYDTAFSLSTINKLNFQSGVHQSVPISASYTLFRYINMSFSVNYDEYWVNEKLYEQYNPQQQKIDSTITNGFFASRDFNAGVQFSSRIYGMKLFKNGKLHGIRHVLTPTIGFVYHPDFGAAPFNYYYKTRLDSTLNYSFLSPYQTSVVGVPPLGKSALINFGLNNNLQIKLRSTKDTVSGYKNVTLIDAFGINTAFNAAADSFKWSDITMNFRTSVLDKLNISAAADFDPYMYNNATGQRENELMIQSGEGIARFNTATLALGANFHSKPKKTGTGSADPTDPTNSEEYGRLMRNNGYKDYVDFKIPWSFNVSYALAANNEYAAYYPTPYVFTRHDTIAISQNVMFQGEFNLTERWKVTFSSGYDFTDKALTLTSIDVYRDLHCWQMHLQTIPFGPRKSFNFTLNAKASILQDLKLTRRRDYRDAAD